MYRCLCFETADAFLKARIVLLYGVPIEGIFQENRNFRVQVEQRPAGERIRLEDVSIIVIATVAEAGSAGANTPAIGRVYIAKAAESAGGHFIEWL